MKRIATYAPRGRAQALDPKAFGLDFLVFQDAPTAPFEIVEGRAVVCIRGPLVQHSDWCWDSYEDIRARVLAAFASENREVVLKIDSPGGDASGCFELARELRALAVTSGKPLTAYVDGCCASAAYALASAASRIVAPPSATVGSIGVIQGMLDATAQDAALGLRYAFAFSGARKADGNPHLPLTETAFAAVQEQVDNLATLFFDLISEFRGMPRASVVGLRAGVFLGANSVGNGLIDAIMTWTELLAGAVPESSASSASGEITMPKSMSETVAELTALAEDKDEKVASRAKKMLAAYLEDDGDEAPPSEKKEKEGDKKEAKAETPDKEEKEKPDADAKAALATGADVIALGRRVQTLEAEKAAEADGKARAAIFASRPDLVAEARDALSAVPTASLQKVLDTYPKILNPAAASFVQGSVGRDQQSPQADASEAAFIAARMGQGGAMAKIENVGRDLLLPILTPEQARAHLAAQSGATNGAAK